MDFIWIGICLFSFVLSAVTLVGYWFFLRPADARQEPELVRPSLDAGKLPEVRGALVELFRSVGERFPGSSKERNPYRKKLLMAGFRWPGAVSVYYGIKCASTLLFAGLLAIVAVFAGDGGFNIPLLPMFCGAGLGFLLPDRVLDIRARRRVARLRSGLPAALDLMILGVESGQSLDLAISDASRGLRLTHPDLCAELAQLQLELRAGHARTDAFRNLADRTQDQEMRKLCSVFVDSDRFGTSLGPALRMHAKYLRTRFRQKAQEAARKVGVKLIFPVFFLIFPSVLLVTLGPACMMVFQQLKTMLQ
jgi:tight adherence protein C